MVERPLKAPARGRVVNKKLRKAAAAAEAARGIAQSVENAKRAAQRAENEARIEVALGRRAAAPEHFAPRDMRSVLVRRAPRLLDRRFESALDRLSKLPAVRPLEDWVPRGKGCMTLFRSLAEHLLARFPAPAIVWNAFHDDNAAVLVALAAHVAGGGSLFEYAKRDFAIPLTRKMCHEILATSSEHGFLDAIRRARRKLHEMNISRVGSAGEELAFRALQTERERQRGRFFPGSALAIQHEKSRPTA